MRLHSGFSMIEVLVALVIVVLGLTGWMPVARLVHGDIEEIFRGGLHEYLTHFLKDIAELGHRIQRAYLGAL